MELATPRVLTLGCFNSSLEGRQSLLEFFISWSPNGVRLVIKRGNVAWAVGARVLSWSVSSDEKLAPRISLEALELFFGGLNFVRSYAIIQSQAE